MSPRLPRATRWLVAALAAVLAIQPAPVRADDPAVLRKWGAAELAKAPASVRSGSPVVKAHYAMTKYCEVLQQHKVGVNATLWGRLKNLARSGDASKWTCGDHANNLTAVMAGMGVKKVAYISGQWSQVPTPNADHGAIVVPYKGKGYVYDPWQLATRRGSYVGASNSMWNGMPSGTWDKQMRKQGYHRFTEDGGTTWHKTVKGALAKHLSGPDDVPQPVGNWRFFSGGQIGSASENTAAYTGTLIVQAAAGRARATLSFGRSETMTGVTIAEKSLVFTRPLEAVVQRYRGFMTGENTMRGTFSHLGPKLSQEHRWWAERK